VAARLGDRSSRHEQTWPRERALLERPPQAGVGTAGVTHRRETSFQHVRQRPGRQYGNLTFETTDGLELDIGVDGCGVNVGVDEAGQDRTPADVDHYGAGTRRPVPLENIDDRPVLDR
jgi:hypothetical protein